MTALEMGQQSNTTSNAVAQQEQDGAEIAVTPVAPTAAQRGETAGVNIRTLIIVRWMAIVGQLAAVLVVHYQLQYDLPMEALLGMIAMSAALNVGITLHRRTGLFLTQPQTGQLLLFDVLQLAVLLFLTGGLHNPFSFLIVAPVTMAASLLSRNCVIGLTVITIGLITILALYHYPLPLDAELQMTPLALFGMWTALCVGTVFMAAYAFSIASDTAKLNDAYEATQHTLQKEQRMSALGALAAAAAHELGSPLSTITLVAKEMAHDIDPDSPLADDVELLQSQAARCRDILAELSQRPDKPPGEEPYNILPLSQLVEQVAERHAREDVAVDIIADPRAGDSREPRVLRTPELAHGLGNLLQNAIQFARDTVTVTVFWDDDVMRLCVHDNGPGFPPALLSRLGEPYVSGRSDKSQGMGLGIFIARTLLERCKGRLVFSNHPLGGAMATVDWDRNALEVPAAFD